MHVVLGSLVVYVISLNSNRWILLVLGIPRIVAILRDSILSFSLGAFIWELNLHLQFH